MNRTEPHVQEITLSTRKTKPASLEDERATAWPVYTSAISCYSMDPVGIQ